MFVLLTFCFVYINSSETGSNAELTSRSSSPCQLSPSSSNHSSSQDLRKNSLPNNQHELENRITSPSDLVSENNSKNTAQDPTVTLLSNSPTTYGSIVQNETNHKPTVTDGNIELLIVSYFTADYYYYYFVSGGSGT